MSSSSSVSSREVVNGDTVRSTEEEEQADVVVAGSRSLRTEEEDAARAFGEETEAEIIARHHLGAPCITQSPGDGNGEEEG